MSIHRRCGKDPEQERERERKKEARSNRRSKKKQVFDRKVKEGCSSTFFFFMSAEEALAPASRHQHLLPDGRVAYEWSQSLSDVTVCVACPPELGVRGRDLDVRIEHRRCRLGLKGNPPYLDVRALLFFFPFSKGDALSLSLARALFLSLLEKKTERASERGRSNTCLFSLQRRRRRAIEIKNGKIAHGPFNLLSSPLSTKFTARDLQRRQLLRVVLDAR